jgi:4-hydroxy-tetrahydrodipicolinate synthase
MSDLDLTGAFSALATPFTASGSEIDWASYEKLLESQLAQRIAGLVPCGTTGESPTLTDAEQKELVAHTVRAARGRAKVIVGTGKNDTKKSIEATQAAFAGGADAAMIVMPYYNRPSQEGLYRHVTLIAQASPGPVVLYNVPARTGVELAVETLLRILDACPNVVALKDASGNVTYCQELLSRSGGDRIAVLCGDDALNLPMLSVGAVGVISVTSNVYPRQVSEVVELARAGRFDAARERHLLQFPLHRALFLEPSPAPVKAALQQKGVFAGASVRPPLVEASAACRGRLSELMAAYEAGS